MIERVAEMSEIIDGPKHPPPREEPWLL